MTHTPGPWETQRVEEDRLVLWGREDALGTFKIADIYETANNEANARLIAAAPELLEALELLVGPEGDLYDPYATTRRAPQSRKQTYPLHNLSPPVSAF
jgi:hypothetical protein